MDWKLFQQKKSERVNQVLTNHLENLPDYPAPLKDAMRYAVLAGGKRVRPFLIYATGEMFSVDTSVLDDCAAAIECIHTYSLVHDDLPAMDDDDLRRGSPTCHIAFDEATAILAGDALQTLAFEILSHSENLSSELKIQLIQLLSRASGYQGMCGGQSIDLTYTDRAVSQPELENMHKLKTGALIEAAVMMPACIAHDVNTEHRHVLQSYASTIGLAFQVQDDILDVISDTETLGKPQGSDISSNKSTYPNLMGLSESQKYLHDLFQQALHALDTIPYNTEVLQSFTHYLVNRTK